MNQFQFEYLIVGAGAAGVQMGYFFQKNNMDYCILEKGSSAGEFFKVFPRHRKLISINKIHTGFDDAELNMRWDWNSLLGDTPELLFKNYSKQYFPDADTLVRYLQDFAAYYKLNIRCNAVAKNIRKDANGMFHVTVGDDEYVCKYLIVASGLSQPYIPEFKGVELCERYFDCSFNPDDFTNQRVLIVGKGNSGFETAENLMSTSALLHLISPSPVKFAWNTHYVGHLRAVNNNLLDTYQLKSQNALINGNIKEIVKTPEGKYLLTVDYGFVNGGEMEQIVYDRVILCCGFQFNSGIFDASCKPELTINNRYPKLASDWASVNIPNLYFAGNLTHSRDFKKTTSGFIHGFRYNSRALFNILQHKINQRPFEKTVFNLDAQLATDVIIKKINLTSALFQQFGFFGDAMIVNEKTGTFEYIDALPAAYIHEELCRNEKDYFVITLEYGHSEYESSFSPNVQRVNKNDYKNADKSLFLHPVIRRYSMGKMQSEQHLIEDFTGIFDRPEHIIPLKEYVETELAKTMRMEKTASL